MYVTIIISCSNNCLGEGRRKYFEHIGPTEKKKPNVCHPDFFTKKSGRAFFLLFFVYNFVAFLTCVVRTSMFFPSSSNSPEANLQKKSCKVIDLSSTEGPSVPRI